jgi:hypothetical protein
LKTSVENDALRLSKYSQEAAGRPKISGYGRRRRSSGDDAEAATAAVTDVALDAVKIRNHGQYGELSRRQSSPYGPKKVIIRRSPAGKKKTTVYETTAAVPADDGLSYDDSLAEPQAEPAAAADSAAPPAAKQKLGRDGAKKGGRGRRDASADKGKTTYPAAEVFLVEVDSDTVKIKNRGKYGNIAQAAAGPVSSRLVFDDHFGKGDKDQTTQQQRRLRRGTAPVVGFIPFSEYDSRRVQILKVEQNDFMALPKRLAAPPVGQNVNQQAD